MDDAKARKIFSRRGGTLRTSEAISAGIHPRDLYGMVEFGTLERVSRGMYRLADLPPISNPDLVTVAARIPKGVICLVSALSFHELTTQIPREVQVALTAGSEKPRLEYPPTKFFWVSGEAFSRGVETHKIDGTKVRIYNVEKTLADCFKYRNKIGLDVALEALRLWAPRRNKWEDFLRYARICRVEKIVKPYLEALA